MTGWQEEPEAGGGETGFVKSRIYELDFELEWLEEEFKKIPFIQLYSGKNVFELCAVASYQEGPQCVY